MKCENLDVWKRSCRLSVNIYKLFIDSKDFGFKDQITRSGLSIPSNIAEGSARNSLKEFVQFCYIALGSLSELETQIIISHNLNFMNIETMENILIKVEEIRRKLLNFIKHLKLKSGNKK